MFYYLLIAAEAASVLLPFLAAAVCIWRWESRRGRKTGGWRLLMTAAFGIYLAGAVYFTGCGTLYDLLFYGFSWRPEQINLLPFSGEIDGTAYFLNVLLFMPMGFFIPALTGQEKPWAVLRQALASGAAVSLVIELSQLLNNRRTDIDDLLLNTLGALAGGLVYLLFRRVLRRRGGNAPAWQPAAYLAAAFLGHFILFNEYGLVRMFGIL